MLNTDQNGRQLEIARKKPPTGKARIGCISSKMQYAVPWHTISDLRKFPKDGSSFKVT